MKKILRSLRIRITKNPVSSLVGLFIGVVGAILLWYGKITLPQLGAFIATMGLGLAWKRKDSK